MLTDNFYSPQGPPGGGGPPGTPIMPSPAGTEIYLKIKKTIRDFRRYTDYFFNKESDNYIIWSIFFISGLFSLLADLSSFYQEGREIS